MEIRDTLCIAQSKQDTNFSVKNITSSDLQAKADLFEKIPY